MRLFRTFPDGLDSVLVQNVTGDRRRLRATNGEK